MKAKVIWWGWCISWFLLFAGLGTWENSEFGSFGMLLGILLCLVWVTFSLLLIENEKDCSREANRMERWMDDMIVKANKRLKN